MNRLAYRVAYWWAVVCYALIPRWLRKVSPRHDPWPAGTNTPPLHLNCRCVLVPAEHAEHCPVCRCALYSASDERQHEIRHHIQYAVCRPMVQRGEMVRGGDPATGKVNMWLTDEGVKRLT